MWNTGEVRVLRFVLYFAVNNVCLDNKLKILIKEKQNFASLDVQTNNHINFEEKIMIILPQ